MKKLLHLLTVTAILSFLSMNVFAQSGSTGTLGDGDDPYLGTTHNYKVTGDGGTVVWTVLKSDGAGGYIDGTADVTLGTNSATGGVNSVDIAWNTAGDYKVKYTETLAGCSTVRELGVTVHTNSFYLYLADNGNACNSEEGNVLDWDTYETKNDVKTSLTFTVNMAKESGFSIDNYQFEGNIVLPSGLTIAGAGDVTVTGGTKTAGTGNGNFNVTVNAADFDSATSDAVTITVAVSGKVTDGGDVTLNLTKGKAVKGAVTTNDNTTDYPTASPGDRTQVITLKPLPGSSNISF